MINDDDTQKTKNATKRTDTPTARAGREGRDGADVIHVDFAGRGGRIGRVSEPPPREAAPQTIATSATSTNAATVDATASTAPTTSEAQDAPKSVEPVTDTFTPREVEKLLGLNVSRLRALVRAGVVAPTATKSGKPAYSFQDLIALRATSELLTRKVKLKDIATAVVNLQQSLPRVTRPLQELRIVSDGRRLVVRAESGSYEPISGQMVLDFQVGALRDDVVRVLRPEASRQRSRTAYDLYVKASALDEDATTFDEAEALYRRAVELDPSLSIAYTNLGNIRFRRGDEAGAEQLYKEALARDDRQPEAHYNLGYVMLERGAHDEASAHFERAIARDPRFADAHFNLAMSLESLGQRAKARTHWKKYLELEPIGTWADIARQHL